MPKTNLFGEKSSVRYPALRTATRPCANLSVCVLRRILGAHAEAVKKVAEADGAVFYLRSFLDAQD